MTLYLGILSLLVLSDFFVLNISLLFYFYVFYLFVFLFSSSNNTILPNKHTLLNNYLNSKLHGYFYFAKFTSILSLFPSFPLRWKPLFKKTSYFGIYRSTRNQWLNK